MLMTVMRVVPMIGSVLGGMPLTCMMDLFMRVRLLHPNEQERDQDIPHKTRQDQRDQKCRGRDGCESEVRLRNHIEQIKRGCSCRDQEMGEMKGAVAMGKKPDANETRPRADER